MNDGAITTFSRLSPICESGSPVMVVLQRVFRLVRMTSARLKGSAPCPNTNLYHCCIQKSGSQWIKRILRDPIVFRHCGLTVHDPGRNFIKPGRSNDLTRRLPARRIITPFYVTYDDFEAMPKPSTYKAIWVMRDPRDVVCSKYYSVRYSHPTTNKRMTRLRGKLTSLSKDDGLMHFIKALGREDSPQMICMGSWLSGTDDQRILICRYEDLVGPDPTVAFRTIFDHLDITIPDGPLRQLLRRYSFEALSGRTPGQEDYRSHYRKGVAGDWRNHFSEEHKRAFKQATGSLMLDLGYENGPDW